MKNEKDIPVMQYTEALSLLNYVSGNLAALSAISTILATLFAGAFLSGYMSRFGYSFLLIFEPSDYLKIVIISGAVMLSYSQMLYLLIKLMDATFKYAKEQGLLFACAINLIFLFTFGLIAYFWTGFYTVFLLLVAPIGIYGIIEMQVLPVIKNATLNWGILFSALTIIGGQLFAEGSQMANYVIVSEEPVQIELSQGNDTIENAKLVMILSHHVILYKDKETIILPVGDITKISRTTK